MNIVSGIIALCISYMLIFEEKQDVIFWGALGVFFALMAARTRYRKRMAKKN
jgi:hypothetical protein